MKAVGKFYMILKSTIYRYIVLSHCKSFPPMALPDVKPLVDAWSELPKTKQDRGIQYECFFL